MGFRVRLRWIPTWIWHLLISLTNQLQIGIENLIHRFGETIWNIGQKILNLPMKNQSAYEKHLNPSLTMVFWFLLFASNCSNNPVWQFAGWHSYLNFPRLSKNIYAHSNLFTTKKNRIRNVLLDVYISNETKCSVLKKIIMDG